VLGERFAVTDDLRALLRADLADERPPPLGDVVGAAIREGRRVRRRRRLAVAAAAAAVLVVAAVAAFGPVPRVPSLPSALPPGSVPSIAIRPATAAPANTVTVRNGTRRAEGTQKKATSAAMLDLLTALLPPGRTSHYAVAPDNALHVQLYYDAGYGPSMLRLAVGQKPTGRERGTTATVTVSHVPGNCVQDTVVVAAWPDGTTVQLDLATCLAFEGRRNPPAKPQLSEAEATVVVSDARWGVTMESGLVEQGARAFPAALPVFGR
jgi:hypothetical protein